MFHLRIHLNIKIMAIITSGSCGFKNEDLYQSSISWRITMIKRLGLIIMIMRYWIIVINELRMNSCHINVISATTCASFFSSTFSWNVHPPPPQPASHVIHLAIKNTHVWVEVAQYGFQIDCCSVIKRVSSEVKQD